MTRRRRFAILGGVVMLLIGLGGWLTQTEDAPTRAAATAFPPLDEASRPSPRPSPRYIEARPEEADRAARPPTPLEREAELVADPDVDVLCTLDVPISEARAHLIVGDPASIPYDGRVVPVVLGRAYLSFLPEVGRGWFAVEGYAPVPITWSAEGECAPDPVVLAAGDAVVTGMVRNAAGEPEGKVFVEGCGNQALTDVDGSYAMSVLPMSCIVQAFRKDGRLVAPSDVVRVTPMAGQDTVVDLSLPPLPRAGLGVQVEATDGGVRVLEVIEGSAAADVGLQSGDLVVEVDGEEVGDMTLAEFVDRAVGDVGTEVEIAIERDGRRQSIVIERRVIN
jgi:membrane-associated protease RseP (regulator of RpoE activity)